MSLDSSSLGRSEQGFTHVVDALSGTKDSGRGGISGSSLSPLVEGVLGETIRISTQQTYTTAVKHEERGNLLERDITLSYDSMGGELLRALVFLACCLADVRGSTGIVLLAESAAEEAHSR